MKIFPQITLILKTANARRKNRHRLLKNLRQPAGENNRSASL